MNKNVKNLLIVGSSLTTGIVIYNLTKKTLKNKITKNNTLMLEDKKNNDNYKVDELMNYENSKIKRKYIRLR